MRFVLFCCIRDCLAELVQKFVPRSRVGIFRHEHTRSSPLDPKLMFCAFILCRYPRTGVPPLAVPRQGSCSYLQLHPSSWTPAVRSPVLPATVRTRPHGWERSGDTTCPGGGRNSCASSRGSGPPKETEPLRGPGPLMGSRTPHGVPDPLYSNRTPH